jgi:hypothetical protein
MSRLRAAVTLIALSAAAAPAPAQDEVTYYDRATRKEMKVSGTVQAEGTPQVVLKPAGGGAAREVPATAILDVVYELPARFKLDYARLRGEERGKPEADDKARPAEDVAKGYEKLLADVPRDRRFARRHLQFKAARQLARRAEEDPAARDAAVAALSAFAKEHPDSWQIHACCRQLARLQLDKKDFAGALATCAAWAAAPALPKDARQECDLLTARVLALSGKVAEARQKLEAAAAKSGSADDPFAQRARVALAACHSVSKQLDASVKELDELIAKVADPEVKAFAYNTLGDCYQDHGRPRDALWAYLWVDVVYSQDRREHAKAVEQLGKVFEELGDAARARQYRDKFRRDFR